MKACYNLSSWATVTGVVACALLGMTRAQAAGSADPAPLFEQPTAAHPDFTGKWLNTIPGGHLLTANGSEPPLTPAGKAELAKRSAALKSQGRKADPVSSCLLHGIPRLLYTAYPFLILQTTRNINFVHEANHTFRNIYWAKAPPEDADPSYLGSAAAHFEGQTLVIDSVAFNDQTWLDYAGLPHGEKLKVQERYTLRGPDKIGATVLISDPDFYSAPWKTTFTLQRQQGMDLKENVCMDTHQM